MSSSPTSRNRPPRSNRSVNYTLRLSAEENTRLRALEQETGLRRSQVLRELLRNGKITVTRIEQADRPLLSNLHHLGVNLNQALRLASQTNSNLFWVQEAITEIKSLIEKYKAQ